MTNSSSFNTSNERNVTLDVAKGLAMILVVWLHAEGPFFAYISRLTVPAFFMVSGYLYNMENSYKKFFIRKVQTLYIPFVFWNVLASTLTAVLGLIPYSVPEFVKHIILIFLTVDKDGAVFGGSWFIASLFLMSTAYKFVDYVLVRRLVTSFSGRLFKAEKAKLYVRVFINLVMFALIALLASYVTLPMRISRTLVLGFFYAIGVVLKHLIVRRKAFEPVLKYFFAIVALGLYVSIAGICHTDLGFNVFDNRGLYIIEVFAGSYVLYIIAEILSHNELLTNALSYVGRHTIDLVIWQYVFFRIVILLQLYMAGEPLAMVTQVYPTYDSSHGWWIVYTVVGVTMSLLFGEVLRRDPWGRILKKYHIV